MATAREHITATAEARGWTLAHESERWQEWRRGKRSVSVTYTAAQAVKHAGHASNENRPGRWPMIGEVNAGTATLHASLDRRDTGKLQRVTSWLTFGD